MKTSVEQAAERGIRYAIGVLFVVGVRRRDPGVVFNAVIAAIGTCVPDIASRAYDVELRPWQRLYVDTAMLTHVVGMLGPYDDVWWWDHLTHTHSATILGGAVFATCRRCDRQPQPRVVAAVAGLGLCWEIAEYAIHVTATRLGYEPVLVSYGKTDTILDLVFDLVGAILVLAFGDRFLENLTTSDG